MVLARATLCEAEGIRTSGEVAHDSGAPSESSQVGRVCQGCLKTADLICRSCIRATARAPVMLHPHNEHALASAIRRLSNQSKTSPAKRKVIVVALPRDVADPVRRLERLRGQGRRRRRASGHHYRLFTIEGVVGV